MFIGHDAYLRVPVGHVVRDCEDLPEGGSLESFAEIFKWAFISLRSFTMQRENRIAQSFCVAKKFIYLQLTLTNNAVPVSKNALIRYKTIDRCLQNRYRRWTLEDLIDACSDALYELEGRDEGVSKRTVQLDIQNLRKLYNAPIKVVEHKYYIYEDPEFSITESPLSEEDVKQMSEAVKVLRELSGFQEFSGMEDIMGRLEDVVHITRDKSRPVVFFEKNDLLKGLEFIRPLHQAILDRHPVKMTYQSFRAKEPSTFLFHPYALKEFNNRWFIFGRRPHKDIENLALDRIVGLEASPETPFLEDPSFDPETWFADMVGVTKFHTDKPERVVFRASPSDAPYIRTKPFHSSQRVLETGEDGSVVFELNIIINRELERLLLGFAEGIRVLSPRKLEQMIKNHLSKSLERYENQKR
jgi:predicted DNA-binding transcriptional regulator YafY